MVNKGLLRHTSILCFSEKSIIIFWQKTFFFFPYSVAIYFITDSLTMLMILAGATLTVTNSVLTLEMHHFFTIHDLSFLFKADPTTVTDMESTFLLFFLQLHFYQTPEE